MGFDRGNATLRMYYIPRDWSTDILEKFARHACPDIENLGTSPVQGWVSFRHLLDRDLRPDNGILAGFLCLQWVQAERKVPESLLRAYIRLEEEVELRAGDLEFLPRKRRAEIRKEVTERLLPEMPPTLSGVQIVFDFRDGILYVGSASDKACDAVTAAVQQATGVAPAPLTPESAALKRRKIKAIDLAPSAFSPSPTVEPGDVLLGDDFLTWLWFQWESEGGIFRFEELSDKPFGMMIDGPLLFVHEAEGAHEAVLRKGSPLASAEAGTALWCGKKLRRCKLVLSQAKLSWQGTIDAEAFSIRSLKMPKPEQVDPVGAFHERMLSLETFRKVLLRLYDRFLEERADKELWNRRVGRIQDWIAHRARTAVSEARADAASPR